MKDLRIVRRAFNAGEVSPQFAYRNDVEKHAFACSKLENFYVSPLGAISRREGTRFLGKLTDADAGNGVRLVPFEYNRQLSYILAFYTTPDTNNVVLPYKYITDSVKLPLEFSLAFTLPADVQASTLIKKSENFIVSYSSTDSGKILLHLGNSTLSAAAVGGDKVVIECCDVSTGHYYAIWVNGVLASSVKTVGFFHASNTPLTVYAKEKGDLMGLKLFDFEMNRLKLVDGQVVNDDDYKGSLYSITDYIDGKDDNSAVRYPDYASQTSVLGSSYNATTGKVDFDFDTLMQGYLNLRIYDRASNPVATDTSGLSHKSDSYLNQEVWYVGGGTVPTTVAGCGDGSIMTEAVIKEQIRLHTVAIDAASDYTDSNKLESDKEAATQNLRLWLAHLFGFDSLSEFAQYMGLTMDFIYGKLTSYLWSDVVTKVDDKITIPLNAGSGNSLYFAGNLPEDVVISANGTELQTGEKLKLESDCTQLIMSVANITRDSDISLTFKTPLNASGIAYHSSLAAQWTYDKVVKLSVYDINGNIKQAGISTLIPYETLQSFQYKQAGLYMFIAHANFAPLKLSMGESGAFAFESAVKFEPSLDNPEKDITLTFGDESAKDGIVFADTVASITANSAFFTKEMSGSQLKLEYSDKAAHTYKWPYRKANNGQKDGYYIGAATAWFPPTGKVVVKPEGGVWEGVLVLEESTDNGKTWGEIGRSSAIQGLGNSQFEREIYDVRSLVRVRLIEQRDVADTSSTKVEAPTEGCFFNIYTNSTCCAWVEIQSVSDDGKSATVRFINPARAYFQTDKVYRSAWNDTYGYPRAVEIHEERLTLAGTARQPSTVWLSQSNNWDNFRSVSNLDTDPLSYTLASDDGEPISWLISKSDLMIGKGGSEWSLGSRDAGQALTASIVKASNQSEDGVEYIMPAKAANMVIYVRRGNMELGSIAYDFASDSYNSISLTTLCPEILGDGINTIFNQLSPRNYIWAIRNDGVCAVFTYDRENNVSAWSRFTFGDGVASGCALSTGKFKSVFLAVKRNEHICLERLDPNEMKTLNWGDCVPISDGMTIPYGLETNVKYTSIVETTPIFLEGHIKVSKAEFIMFNSYGGQYRLKGFNDAGEGLAREQDWRNLAMRNGNIPSVPTPRTYRFTGSCDSGYLEECSIEVKTDENAPFTLSAIAVKAGGV